MSTVAATDRDAAEDAAAAALQDALAAVHAALWSYSLAVAFLPPDQAEAARADAEAHLRLRAGLEQTISELGSRPRSALAAYSTPAPVVDAASAADLAVVAETDVLVAWRSVAERSADAGVRAVALDGLTEGTRRCARWRTTTGRTPAIPPFPGRP